MLAGSLLGTSPVGAYVESSAGIAVGGRSWTNSCDHRYFLFVWSILFSAFISSDLSGYSTSIDYCRRLLMAQSLKEIKWHEMEIAIPSFSDFIRHAFDL